MDLKQVISQLEDLQGHCQEWWDKDDEDSIWERDVQALGKAIKMVEKEIPKKLICEIADKNDIKYEFEHYKCPSCRVILHQRHKRSKEPIHKQNYCHNCGQKLDWEEEE